MPKPSKPSARKASPTQGRAHLSRLRRVSEAEIARRSPAELRDLARTFMGALQQNASTSGMRCTRSERERCSGGRVAATLR